MELQSFFKEPGLQQLASHVRDEEVFKLLGDLQETIHDYQVCL